MPRADFTLDDRYTLDTGVVLLSGIHALARLPMEQRRWDDRHGLRTGGFISGYRGSPIGGLDQELWRRADDLARLGIVFQPGVNEDLAATAAWGTQQVGLFAGARVDGVFALWYGKAPGLDRSCDAIRHANAAGTSPNGGVLLAVGDDPGCKSSTLPSNSEFSLRDLGVPTLAPSSVQEVLDFGMAGWALSRFSGCWTGLITTSETMDASATVVLPDERGFVLPDLERNGNIRLLDQPLDQEQRLFEHKLQLAMAFAAANGLNRVISNPATARLTIIAAGKPLGDTRQALEGLGFPTPTALADNGVRLVQLGLIWPLEESFIREVCRDTPRVLVVEEKRGLIEEQVKACLFHTPGIEVFGKRDPAGELLIPAVGEATLPIIAHAVAKVLGDVPNPDFLTRLAVTQEAVGDLETSKEARVPLFCAGCPHNTSTKVPAGSRAAAGIGCHYMAQWMDRSTWTFTHMGGEGANWLGQAPFTDEGHIFVNMGDGTFNHSGLLAIRAAVAAGVNVTYKILFNDAVAMTGGQPMDGGLSVADVVQQVQAAGVAAVRVVSDDPRRHAGAAYDALPRERLDQVQRELRATAGCTALVYEQTCATELRRRRKRGLEQDPDVRVVINEAVCEGCGDCAVQSNCVAVEPVATPLGTKRRINQTACNKDLSCVDGFCPSFVTVRNAAPKRRAATPDRSAAASLPTPRPRRTDEATANILLTGVGGSGIVTLSQILAAAAHMDGKYTTTLDMTGLAQKGGAVLAHIRISALAQPHHAARIPIAAADTVVAADLVTAAGRDVLVLFDDDRTLTVANAHVAPTAEFLLHRRPDKPGAALLRSVAAHCAETRSVDAERLTTALLGDAMVANVFLLGYAFQAGGIPLSQAALERAITLNGVAVDKNLAAFAFGRIAAHDPTMLPVASDDADRHRTPPFDRRRFLVAYQNETLARRFDAVVERVRATEDAASGDGQVTQAVASGYFKLLTPKDEYEVARLFTTGAFDAQLSNLFEPGFRVSYHMAPPILSRPGSRRKMKLGAWLTPLLRVLARLRVLRGTVLDPLRYTRDRKLEHRLRQLFEDDVDLIVAQLSDANRPAALELARWPQAVKGFGFVKERAAEVALQRREELRNGLLETAATGSRKSVTARAGS